MRRRLSSELLGDLNIRSSSDIGIGINDWKRGSESVASSIVSGAGLIGEVAFDGTF